MVRLRKENNENKENKEKKIDQIFSAKTDVGASVNIYVNTENQTTKSINKKLVRKLSKILGLGFFSGIIIKIFRNSKKNNNNK